MVFYVQEQRISRAQDFDNRYVSQQDMQTVVWDISETEIVHEHIQLQNCNSYNVS